MSSTEILEKVKGKLNDADFAAVANLVNKNVVALGTDEAFALADSSGVVRAYKQRVTLSELNGTLVNIQGQRVVSAPGYELLGEAAGAVVIFPGQVLVNGELRANPFVERDPANKRVLSVYCRAVAFRFSSKGIPQVSDWTTTYDSPNYRLIDLLGKAKDNPGAFRLLPIETAAPDDKGTWAVYPFDDSTRLWVNTSHDEALSWYSNIINREKKAIDFAQTFARRNALKHLLGIYKAPKDLKTPEWNVTVFCWRPTSGSIIQWSMTQYAQLQHRVDGIIAGRDGSFIENKKVELLAGTERVSDDKLGAGAIEHEDVDGEPEGADLAKALDVPFSDVTHGDEPTGESEAPPKPDPPTPPAPAGPGKEAIPPARLKAAKSAKGNGNGAKLTREEQAIMANFDMAKKQWPNETVRALKALNIPEGAEITPALADKVNRKISAILDESM